MPRPADHTLEAAFQTAKVRDVLPDGGEVVAIFDDRPDARAYATQMNGLGAMAVYCAKQTIGRALVLRYSKGRKPA